MPMMTSRIGFGLACLALVAACASTTTGGDTSTETMPTGPGDAGAPAEKAPDAAPPSTPPKKDSGTPAPDTGECGTETTQTACVTCCSNKHMDGAGVYFVALIDCMCLAENCAKECEKTICDPDNPTNADKECQACVGAKNNKCSPSVKNTCQADGDCVLFDACVGKSDCTGKPAN